MRTLRYYILFIAFVCAQVAVAQVSFEATVKKDSVPLNKHIEVSFTASYFSENSAKETMDFNPPVFNDFTIIRKGESYQITFKNDDKKRKHIAYNYYYQLLPKKQGVSTIEEAEFKIGRKSYKTKPLNIKIKKPELLNNIHFTVELSNQTIYKNELSILTYKILTKAPIYQISTLPYNYYINPPMDIEKSDEYSKTLFNGEEFYSYTISVELVYLKEDEVIRTIPPESVEIQLKATPIKKDLSAHFTHLDSLNNIYLTSQEVTIRTLALPKDNKPKQFLNAVGTFDLKVVPTVLQIKKGETLNVKVQVSGEGNLYLLEMPLLTTTMQETPKPTEEKQIDVVENRIVGTKNNTYTFIPQETGNFVINPIEFSYFDPKIKKYKTIITKSITIQVTD
ncbi:MAG: BatD family protein [Flavobacteriaceae bacterium]|jgi:hypothetical protein|nr:BatD family protein [Flavobacteriaceae bacterium]